MWCTRSYLNKSIDILRNSNIGCRYGSPYMAVYCFTDDLTLLSPTYIQDCKNCQTLRVVC